MTAAADSLSGESPGTGLESLLLEGLNRALDEVLSVDPDTARQFSRLLGKIFCIELTLPPITLYLLPEPDGFTLATTADGEPDVTLRGSVFGFARLSGRGAAANVIGGGQVTMQGDAEAGQTLQKIFAAFDFDWEELVARVVGDTPARKIGNLVRDSADNLKNSAELGRENLGDYLVEEKRILVGHVALERFSRSVDALRADTDRLTQRVDRLGARKR